MPSKTQKKCNKLFEREVLKKIKGLDKTFKKYKLNTLSEKSKTRIRALFERTLCNENCIGTVFENGDPNKLTPATLERIKVMSDGNKKLEKTYRKLYKENRKKLFGTSNSIIDSDSFYNKTKKNYKKSLKDDGALSYCSELTLDKL